MATLFVVIGGMGRRLAWKEKRSDWRNGNEVECENITSILLRCLWPWSSVFKLQKVKVRRKQANKGLNVRSRRVTKTATNRMIRVKGQEVKPVCKWLNRISKILKKPRHTFSSSFGVYTDIASIDSATDINSLQRCSYCLFAYKRRKYWLHHMAVKHKYLQWGGIVRVKGQRRMRWLSCFHLSCYVSLIFILFLDTKPISAGRFPPYPLDMLLSIWSRWNRNRK